MGRYGVYRTFYETPKKFKALAAFSGSPDLGRVYAPDSEPPSFLDPTVLTAFREIPIFVSHGERDRNVSFDETLEVVERLRSAGARVEFHSEPDRGHQAPSDAAIEKYHRWIHSVVEP